MVSQREDKLERREQKISDREMNLLKREELLACKAQRITELEKLVEYKNARTELHHDILRQREAERKRKKRLKRAESASRGQTYYTPHLFTMPDLHDPKEAPHLRLAS